MDLSCPDQAAVLLRALLDNADDLVADAVLLLEHDRWPRAYALAALAAEELGKVATCLDTLTGARDLPGPRAREWVNHREKLASAAAFEAAFLLEPAVPDPEGFAAIVSVMAETKMATLYVDYDEAGLRRPRDVSSEAASELLARVRSWLSALHRVLHRVTPEVVAAMSVWRPQIEALLAAVFDEGDVPGSLRRAQQLVRAALADDEAALAAVLGPLLPAVTVDASSISVAAEAVPH